MTKDEYLYQLKNNLRSLTEDEAKEALQYYSDFIDEADDPEQAMKELGSPETVAETIKEKLSNAVAKQTNNVRENEAAKEEYYKSTGLFFKYERSLVKSLSLNVGAAEVVIIKGGDFSIETRGIEKQDLFVQMLPEGNLVISNSKKMNFNFFSHDRQSRIFPRILLSIPEKASLAELNVSLGMGYIKSQEIDVSCARGKIEVGAGNLVISKVNGTNLNFRCGMGNLEYSGSVKGRVNIDCGMGNVSMQLNGNPQEYSYDAKVCLGEFKFNDVKRKGVCQEYNQQRKENHISVNCGMGNVSVNIKE